jgi:hypothetical protein
MTTVTGSLQMVEPPRGERVDVVQGPLSLSDGPRLDVGPPAVEMGGDQRGGPPVEFLQSAGFAFLQEVEPLEGEVSAAAGQVGAGRGRRRVH